MSYELYDTETVTEITYINECRDLGLFVDPP